MNTTYLRFEAVRILRQPVALFFIVFLPAFMYVIFGATTEWGGFEVAHGNVSMSIMIAMAAFGAVTATVGVGGNAAVERVQGWGRQLALTPLRDSQYVAVKAAIAMATAALPILVIYGLGFVLGAEAAGVAWVTSLLFVLLGSATFALYGMMFGLAFKSEAATSVASGSVVLLGFLGNLFVPLSGVMLTIAKFTPLYGYAGLARYPVTQGRTIDISSGELMSEPLWGFVVNVVAWTLVFGAAAVLLVRRARD